MLLLQTEVFPDVSISKPPTISIPIGTNGNYTITVNNTGDVPAPNVTVVELLPPGLQFVNGPPGCSADNQTVTCVIGNMPLGGSFGMDIIVKPTLPGPLVVTGNVTAPGDSNLANNGPVSTSITVVRTCGVYNGDGSGYACPAGFVSNTNNSQSTSPSDGTCCVSVGCEGSHITEFFRPG
jgi:uncharacterized repeat protein (TIGR01451 family)